MTRILLILVVLAVALTQSGCATACGPVRSVPTQKLSLVTPTPASYIVRVHPDTGAPIDIPVSQDGRLTFDVPVTSRDSTIYFLLLPVYHYPPPDTVRAIRVMQGDRTVRRLSARDIARLPTDTDGYHELRIEK